MASVSREEAILLWKKHNDDASLLKHAYAVEAVMKHYARLNNADENEWGLLGLLHDIDYGRYPKEHCIKAKEILETAGFSADFIRAVQSHGFGLCTDVEPISVMEKTLFAVDELAGFITACALVRPSRSLDDLELKSVKKKWKDKAFAAGVDRSIIQKGADLLGINLDDLIKECILALKPAAEHIGLNKI